MTTEKTFEIDIQRGLLMDKKGILCIMSAAAIYGLTPVLARITYDMGNNALSMTFYRSFLSIPPLFLLIRHRKTGLGININLIKKIIVLSILGLTTTALLYSSYLYIGIGTTTTLHFMYPIFVAFIAKRSFNEHLDKKKIVALGLAFLGILFFIEARHTANLRGVVMATASALTYSFFLIGLETEKIESIDSHKLSFYLALFSSLALLIGNLFKSYIIINLSLKVYLIMIIASLGTSVIAIALLQEGISLIGSTNSALFSLIEPITSIASGVLFLSETLTLAKIVGCTIILGTISYLTVINSGLSIESPGT